MATTNKQHAGMGMETELRGLNDLAKALDQLVELRAVVATQKASIVELVDALRGADKAITKALPHVPADAEGVYCGEWLVEIRKALADYDETTMAKIKSATAPSPATVTADAGALEALRTAVTEHDERLSRLPSSILSAANAVPQDRVVEAARRLLTGGAATGQNQTTAGEADK